jgi:hypothetical protein
MRFFLTLFLAIAALANMARECRAEPVLAIIFSGNSWGYLKPCPT